LNNNNKTIEIVCSKLVKDFEMYNKKQ